jgi:hypothetical protein
MQRDHHAGDRNECHDATSTAVFSEHDRHDASDERNDLSGRDNTGWRYAADKQQREWRKHSKWAGLSQFDGSSAVLGR